jgi:predicted phosphoadenosine phosphosulfate sulfurtransferase
MLRYFGKYWKGQMKQACSLVANIMEDKKQVVHYLLHCALPFAEQSVFAAQHCFLQPQHPDTPCPALPRL